MEAKNLQPYINQDVQEVAKLVEYLDRNNKVKRGYKAEILPNLCDIYLQAEKDGKIKKKIEYIDCFMENIHKFDKYFVVDR